MEAITRYAFGHTQCGWLARTYNLRRIAWTPSLRAYFKRNFVRLLVDDRGDALWVRKGLYAR